MTDNEVIERLLARRENVYDFATQGSEWLPDPLCVEAAGAIARLSSRLKQLGAYPLAPSKRKNCPQAEDGGL